MVESEAGVPLPAIAPERARLSDSESLEVVAFAVAWVRAGLAVRPHRLPSGKAHRMQNIRAKVLS
jgi:hypothetical protein